MSQQFQSSVRTAFVCVRHCTLLLNGNTLLAVHNVVLLGSPCRRDDQQKLRVLGVGGILWHPTSGCTTWFTWNYEISSKILSSFLGYWHQRADERHGNPPL